MRTPLQAARQEQEQPARPSVLGRIAKGALVAGGLSIAGTYGRGLLSRGVSKGTATDVLGTIKAGATALKGDYAGVKDAVTGGIDGTKGLRDTIGAKFKKWNDAKLKPDLINSSMNSASLSATTSRFRELNAACDEVVHFEHDSTGRFIAKPKEKEGMSTGAKVAAGAAGTAAIVAGVVAGRGYLDGKRGAGVFKAGMNGFTRDAGNLGKSITQVRSGVPVRGTTIGRDILRDRKLRLPGGELKTGYGTRALVQGVAK